MSSNPFEMVDPFSQKEKEKEKQSKNEFIQKFIQIIQNKDKQTLLEINQLLINKLEELK